MAMKILQRLTTVVTCGAFVLTAYHKGQRDGWQQANGLFVSYLRERGRRLAVEEMTASDAETS
jgi:hypothetical protein